MLGCTFMLVGGCAQFYRMGPENRNRFSEGTMREFKVLECALRPIERLLSPPSYSAK
jgi:hypothetical protein